MAKKTTEELEDLQGAVADAFSQSIKDMKLSGEYNAAILNGARQLLKDNNIVTIPNKGNPLGDLAEVLPFDEKDRMVQ